jgi:hypothetical protein
MTILYRPMGDTSWKRPDNQRRASQFSAEWKDTLALLAREVELLGGEDITIELEVLPGAIRLDGLGLKAHQQPASPAVVVSFETEHGVLTYPNDALDSPTWRNTAGWRHNVRGVALTLEGLRAIERYGASDRGQQYTGYAALPAGAMAMGGLTRAGAIEVFASHAGLPVEHFNTDPESLRHTFRQARAKVHPDRVGGDRAKWDALEEAATVLGVRDA